MGWEDFVIEDAYIPPLGDANGKPIALLGKVMLRVRLSSAVYQVTFLVADTVAVPVIIGTCFMTKHVISIRCIDQYVQFTRAKLPILAMHDREEKFIDLNDNETLDDPNRLHAYPRTPRTPPQASQNLHKPHTIRLAKYTKIPARSQVAVSVVTEASGLVFVEPKHSVQARYHVRTANGIVEANRNRRFDLVISNFSKFPRALSKGMVIAYATRNPLGIY